MISENTRCHYLAVTSVGIRMLRNAIFFVFASALGIVPSWVIIKFLASLFLRISLIRLIQKGHIYGHHFAVTVIILRITVLFIMFFILVCY